MPEWEAFARGLGHAFAAGDDAEGSFDIAGFATFERIVKELGIKCTVTGIPTIQLCPILVLAK